MSSSGSAYVSGSSSKSSSKSTSKSSKSDGTSTPVSSLKSAIRDPNSENGNENKCILVMGTRQRDRFMAPELWQQGCLSNPCALRCRLNAYNAQQNAGCSQPQQRGYSGNRGCEPYCPNVPLMNHIRCIARGTGCCCPTPCCCRPCCCDPCKPCCCQCGSCGGGGGGGGNTGLSLNGQPVILAIQQSALSATGSSTGGKKKGKKGKKGSSKSSSRSGSRSGSRPASRSSSRGSSRSSSRGSSRSSSKTKLGKKKKSKGSLKGKGSDTATSSKSFGNMILRVVDLEEFKANGFGGGGNSSNPCQNSCPPPCPNTCPSPTQCQNTCPTQNRPSCRPCLGPNTSNCCEWQTRWNCGNEVGTHCNYGNRDNFLSVVMMGGKKGVQDKKPKGNGKKSPSKKRSDNKLGKKGTSSDLKPKSSGSGKVKK